QAYAEVLRILRENTRLLSEMAETLLEKEKIDGEEFERIFTRYHVRTDSEFEVSKPTAAEVAQIDESAGKVQDQPGITDPALAEEETTEPVSENGE
ncbi:MAG: hypothetical protein PHP40_07450, partial [Eubacteriales bacterium]|nr:hypothetical protein [Eubacteriales bacterium]